MWKRRKRDRERKGGKGRERDREKRNKRQTVSNELISKKIWVDNIFQIFIKSTFRIKKKPNQPHY